jgi:L-ascorbate metabolism protein UlaG (beta-lactamase superfamily)
MRTRLLVAVAALGLFSCTKSQGDPPVSSASPPLHAPPPASATSTVLTPAASATAEPTARPTDVIRTKQCDLGITPLHHATLMIRCDKLFIYVDPVHDTSYAGLPKADMIFITDIHGDHLDPAGIEMIRQDSTQFVAPPAVAEKLPDTVKKNLTVLKNGDKKTLGIVGIEAIPMYNLTRGPKPGQLFHDKGRGNGYVLTLGDTRVYLSGDTECTPEMKALKDINVAFVCMNLPYTMPPSEAAECVNTFKPKVVYPYHYRGSDPTEFQKAVTAKDVEVRIRDWYAQ